MEINPIKALIADLSQRTEELRGIFDYDKKSYRLLEINRELKILLFGMMLRMRKILVKKKQS